MTEPDRDYHLWAASNALSAANAASEALTGCEIAAEQYVRAAKAATEAAAQLEKARGLLRVALRDLNAAASGYIDKAANG